MQTYQDSGAGVAWSSCLSTLEALAVSHTRFYQCLGRDHD